MRTASTNDRDRALRRLRRSTAFAVAGAGALVVAFAGLAARALPGHQAVKISHARVRTTKRQATPPPLVPARSAATPAAPAQPPVQTQAPPVAVSGGT